MKILVILGFFIMMNACIQKNAVFTFCNTSYSLQEKKIYLEDYDLESTMVQAADSDQQFVFGYFKNAIRNDTNFIESSLRIIADTFYRTDHFKFKIDPEMDSVVAVYLCNTEGIWFLKNETYLNGRITKTQILNRLTDPKKKAYFSFCNKKFRTSESKLFLKKYDVEATIVQVLDKQGQTMFRYYKDARRNDTNFIYSTNSFSADTVFLTDHFRYGIHAGLDSTVISLYCKDNQIWLNKQDDYFNSKIIKTVPFDERVN